MKKLGFAKINFSLVCNPAFDEALYFQRELLLDLSAD